jgi:hypothetical protein
MSSVGFTGTRAGMTIVQMSAFFDLYRATGASEWHDGDCVGADDQAHRMVHGDRLISGSRVPVMHGHPCNIDSQRAFNEFDVEHDVKAPLVRNRDIVDCSDVIYAAPKEYDEQMHGSGTWATMRYAVRRQKKLVAIWPDGTYQEDYVPESMR